jgi:hypothetical protein
MLVPSTSLAHDSRPEDFQSASTNHIEENTLQSSNWLETADSSDHNRNTTSMGEVTEKDGPWPALTLLEPIVLISKR